MTMGRGPEGEFSQPVNQPGSVTVTTGAEHTIVTLAGEVDAESSAELQAAAARCHRAGLPVIVHCTDLTFTDSTGLSFLASLLRTGEPAPIVQDAPASLRILLQTTGMLSLFDLH